MIMVTTALSKSPAFNMFSVHSKTKSRCLNSSALKSVFEILGFLDGLVWRVGLTVEIKLRFQISLA